VTARHGEAIIAPHEFSTPATARVEVVVTATLRVNTRGQGLTEITDVVARFVKSAGAGSGMLLLFLRHTSASLVIQENADPDVQTDLVTALERLVPLGQHWRHDSEGPDDMPSHVKSMLNGVSLQVPVADGSPLLGVWQGIYLVEHRARPHRREVVLQFIGSRG
jgi:secondary thiamine-phosphate synthase enzyme